LFNSLSKENSISNKLQQDILKIEGKTIFINPFLYWRKFDESTNRWLREIGQIPQGQIELNRNRFYPELDWSLLSEDEKLIKDGSVEMFLKTLDLVITFHPTLNSSQMLQVEMKMTRAKKNSFEKWVKNSFAKKAKITLREKRKFQRDMFIRNWHEWFSLDTTHTALLPIVLMIFLSAFIGWSAGISRNSCNPYFESETNKYI
tara:strand:- start:493 stop:1101 length:609 start_codon:yes stop_codon:yes gene_type:complete